MLITGAASGVGRSLCVELAKQGEASMLIIWDIQKDALEETETLVKDVNPTMKVRRHVVNLAKRGNIYKVGNECINYLGGNAPDIVISNAGVFAGTNCLNTDDERIEMETAINTLAAVWLAKLFTPRMVKTGKGGQFVFVSSFTALMPFGDMTTYAMSKAGANGFAAGFNDEVISLGYKDLIKISVICPGHIDTPMFKGAASGDSIISPEFVAKEIISAVECQKEIVIVPSDLNNLAILGAIRQYFGRLNLMNNMKYMEQWSPAQTESVFQHIENFSKLEKR